MSVEYENTYDAPFPAIQDVTSRELDNLVLLYQGPQNRSVRALGFRILRSVRRRETVENEPTLQPDGDQGDTLDFGYFGENGHSEVVTSAGDEVFRVDNERSSTIIEYGFEVEPDGVQVSVETADGSTVFGLREGADRARGFGPSDFSLRGSILSDLTRTTTRDGDEVPTTALAGSRRQGLFRIDSDENGLNRFRFAFSNTTGNAVDVGVTAKGQTYHVQPVEDRETVLDMVSKGGTPARVVTWGGFTNSSPNLPREWTDALQRINTEQISFA